MLPFIICMLIILSSFIFTSLSKIKNPKNKIIPIICLGLMCLAIYLFPIYVLVNILRLLIINKTLLNLLTVLIVIPATFWFIFLKKQYIRILNS